MATVDYAKERIRGALEEIARLKQSEFPYDHPRDAIGVLEGLFQKQSTVLHKISPKTSLSVTNQQCSMSLELLFQYVPILGFILRSTNIRNGFEVLGPLLRLARKLMGTETKLILSSEWEFSPFVYSSITELPDFILIALPATESSNPLVFPLAGHELGHSIWANQQLAKKFDDRIKKGISDELKSKRWNEYSSLYKQYSKEDIDGNWQCWLTWQPAFKWAMLQAEEVFCDFFGLRLFYESYLHAFGYLIAPGIPGPRSLQYPNIKNRVNYLVKGAGTMGINIPHGFTQSFNDETEPEDPTPKLLASIADQVLESIVDDLLKEAKDFIDKKEIPSRDTSEVKVIINEFKTWIAPSSKSQELVNILNAGWDCLDCTP